MHQLGGQTVNLNATLGLLGAGVARGHGDGRARRPSTSRTRPRSSRGTCTRSPSGRRSRDARGRSIGKRREHPHVGGLRGRSRDQHGERPVASAASVSPISSRCANRSATLRGKQLAIAWTQSPTPAITGGDPLAPARGACAPGMNVRLAHPTGLRARRRRARQRARRSRRCAARRSRARLALEEAVAGAHVVYARSWQSLEVYGNPTLAASRARAHERLDDRRALMALGARRAPDARHAGPA